MAQQKINFLRFLKAKEKKEIPPVIIIKNKWEGYDNENIQLAAVQQNGEAIQYIENPSEQLILVAVKQKNVDAIKYIQNPSEQVQLAAVQENAYSIRYIQNPSEELILAAVKKNGYAIEHIKNPSEQVQLAAVKKNGRAIAFINKKIIPSEEVFNAAKKSLIKKYGQIPDDLKNYFK